MNKIKTLFTTLAYLWFLIARLDGAVSAPASFPQSATVRMSKRFCGKSRRLTVQLSAWTRIHLNT